MIFCISPGDYTATIETEGWDVEKTIKGGDHLIQMVSDLYGETSGETETITDRQREILGKFTAWLILQPIETPED